MTSNTKGAFSYDIYIYMEDPLFCFGLYETSKCNLRAELTCRPNYKDHVWSYDFVIARISDGRPFRILTILDEYTRESLATFVNHRISSQDVIDQLFHLFVFRGIPEHIRSDNDPEFTSKAIRDWLNRLGVKTLFIEPGSPWENGYIESFNGKLRDELLNREIFTTLTEAKVLIEEWRREYNQIRLHSSLRYRPPAPEAILPITLTQKVVQLMGAGYSQCWNDCDYRGGVIFLVTDV